MRRGWKILIGVAVAVAVLLVLNALSIDHETKAASVTEAGGEIVEVGGKQLEVVERGPKSGAPIVLIHCFTCAINYWDGMVPPLARRHRVIAVDLLGHGGSEKPASGYSVPDQASAVAEVLAKLGVRDAEVVGHSLGGPVAIALAEQAPQLVDRLVAIDSIPDTSYGDVGFIGELPFKPVLGEALWRIKPDFTIRDGLEVAFAPGPPAVPPARGSFVWSEAEKLGRKAAGNRFYREGICVTFITNFAIRAASSRMRDPGGLLSHGMG